MSQDNVQGPAKVSAPLFERFDNADVRLLIDRFPLAWVSATGADEASLLPLVGVYDEQGALVELIGHFAVNNPLARLFASDPKALILFSGPSGYISPALAGLRDWGPTWNYAQLRISADIRLEPEGTADALDVLIGKMEADAEQPWSASELGPRFDRMLPRIMGFRASVRQLRGIFKLGQDESPAVLHSILDQLPDPALAEWMRRFNRGRV
jgi:transcriptional regulator